MDAKGVKEDRFKRLAAKRTNEILKRLDILGHCANRSSYDYSREQIDQIILAIEKKVNEVKTKFRFPEDDGFKL
jgi:hypothetical protein